MKRVFRKRVIAGALTCALLLGASGCGAAEDEFTYGEGLSALNEQGVETDDSTSASDSDSDILIPGSSGSSGSGSSGLMDGFEPQEYAEGENEEFQQFMRDYFADSVTSDTVSYNYAVKDGSKFDVEPPETATLGDPKLDEDTIAEQEQSDREFYDELMAFEDQPLNEDERFTFECLKTDTELGLHLYDNIYLYEPFSPMRGPQSFLPTNFTDYRFDDKSDVEDYVALINGVKYYFDEMIKFEYVKSEKGYFMSDAVADEVITQCDEFTADKEDHFMIEVFNNRIDKLDFLTDEEKADFKEQNKEAMLNSMIPAFEDLKACLEELKGTGVNDLGICNWEGGKDYYTNYIFPSFSGSSKTPEEEIEVMEARMSSLTMEMTMAYYSDPDGYEYFTDNYDNITKETDSMEATELIDYIQANCMDDYPDMDEIKYSANRLDKRMEVIMENTLAYYMSPAIDDQDNNIIYVNGAHTDGMWTTLAHEGCPGHMFQNAYFMSTDPNPVRVLQGNLGYMEGWAVYSSYGTVNQCDFGNEEHQDTIATIYRLNEDLGYLLYGRLDLAVNYEGWTKEQVTDYLVNNGYSSDHVDEIMTTITGTPGVYLSYTTGFYEMEELRNEAEAELGAKFNLKDFNTVILDAGPCQFENLKKKVCEYVYENQ